MKKTSEKKSGLKFFGIGKMLPFLKKYRRMMVLMVLFGIGGSVIDIGTPLLQRYELCLGQERPVAGGAAGQGSAQRGL